MKTCTKCHATMPLANFAWNKKLELYQSWCRDCHNQWRRDHRERYFDDPLLRRTRHLQRTYGLTQEEYLALFKKQGGVCAICKQPETRRHGQRGVSMLAVDHDHATGAIRGLLCTKCNTAIGSFEDNLELMTRAMQYLQRAISQAKVAQLPLFGDEEG